MLENTDDNQDNSGNAVKPLVNKVIGLPRVLNFIMKCTEIPTI